MECVLLIGLQGSGKSSFYKERLFHTHVRINLDMLRTRHREDIFLAASLQAKQKFAVDNTNPRRQDRKKYVDLARQFGFAVIAYFMEPDLEGSLGRNAGREGKARVPAAAVRRTYSLLEPPDWDEGFDEIYRVRLREGDDSFFEVTPVDRQL